MLAACGLGFSYRAGTPVLRDVSIELSPGSFTAILGVNGCGKSTLLSCLMGLRKPDAGQVLLDGVPMGGDLEYTDEVTLSMAMNGRREM